MVHRLSSCCVRNWAALTGLRCTFGRRPLLAQRRHGTGIFVEPCSSMTSGRQSRRVPLTSSFKTRAHAVTAPASHQSTTPPAQPEGYQMPPKEIAEIVNEPVQPGLSISPDRKRVLQMYWPAPLPPITELARPELKLAGLRIDPEIATRSRMSSYIGFGLLDFTDTVVLPAPAHQETRVHGYPEGWWLNYVTWSKDSKQLAFAVRCPGRVEDPPRKPLELWVADAATGTAHCLLPSPQMGLNGVFDDYLWVDDDTIAALVVPEGRGEAPAKPPAPPGPRISSNLEGSVSQARTYQDLLKNTHDEDVFEYHGCSDLVYVKVSTGEVQKLGSTRMYTGLDASPDGRFVIVSWLERPFSYTIPCGRFPKVVQLWDRQGNCIRELARLPLAEDIPIAFNSCRQGPRSIGWRDDQPAELSWIECQDGGDPSREVSPRDIVYTLPADACSNGAGPRQLAQTDLRCGGIAWGNDDLALLYETWWKTRRSKIWALRPGQPSSEMQILFDRNYEDSYSDPGSPCSRRTSDGTYVLAMVDDQRKLLLQGTGASAEGNEKGWGRRPFLDVIDVDSGKKERLWQSSPPFYESAGTLLTEPDKPVRLEGLQFLFTRETQEDPPQYYIKTLTGAGAEVQERQLSSFPHPHPTLKGAHKDILRYKRADGVDLTATLYTPPGYDKDRDGPLPCIVWAYPREFKSKDAAGQMTRSPYSFYSIGSQSPLLWLSRSFAVLDGPTMPIIAEGEEEPNDTYVQQLTDSARAAIEEATRQRVVDPTQVAVGGHSYGAFMAANLLAHAPDLFACGIAKSGAYNRTLTPFGFQSEERTIWQAPHVYNKMSPFMQADKIKKPLLLIHGEDDDNAGTFPLQSERLYAALKGHGAPTRLVILPHESHGYRARESVMHTLYEMDAWLEQWCCSNNPKAKL